MGMNMIFQGDNASPTSADSAPDDHPISYESKNSLFSSLPGNLNLDMDDHCIDDDLSGGDMENNAVQALRDQWPTQDIFQASCSHISTGIHDHNRYQASSNDLNRCDWSQALKGNNPTWLGDQNWDNDAGDWREKDWNH